MAGGFVGVDLFLASGRLLGSCALSVRCGPGNTGQDTIGFEIEIEIEMSSMCHCYATGTTTECMLTCLRLRLLEKLNTKLRKLKDIVYVMVRCSI